MSTHGSNEWRGDVTALAGGGEAAEPAFAVPADPTTAELTPVGTPAGTAAAGPAPDVEHQAHRAPARWTRSPNVVDRPTLLGVMVLPAEGPAVVLTGVVADVWRALARPTAGGQLVDRVAARPTEVADALRRLRAMGAVREMR